MSSRKDLISAFVDLKRKHQDPRQKIKRDEFLKHAKCSRPKLTKLFGGWKEFLKQASQSYVESLTTRQRALLSEIDKGFDADASKEDCIKDLRDLQEANWGKHITRDFYRHNGRYSDSTWGRHFGTFQEYRRQAGLELTRHQHKVERAIAQQASIDHYRAFFEKEVLPYFNKYVKTPRPYHIKTILAMSDLHDKECCEFSLSVFIEECRIKQPDVIVLNGDIYDLLEFGKYNIDIRHIDIVGRFDFVRERVFRPLREACPHSQIDLIAGNHEMRLLRLLCDATPNVRVLLSDVVGLSFSDIFGLDEFEINWASKFDLAAYSNKDIKNQCKKNYRIYFNTFVFTHIPDKRLKAMSGSNGHHHTGKIESYAYVNEITGLVKQLAWSQTPAMHVKDAEYLGNTSGWNTGFLEVIINCETRESIQKIHFTHDDWCVIDGRYYARSEDLKAS